MRALAVPSSIIGSILPSVLDELRAEDLGDRFADGSGDELGTPAQLGGPMSTALPRNADDCYDLFCDVKRIPEWLSVVRSAVVTKRDHHDRAADVAFLARLERATVGYTCHYRYTPAARRVDWATAPDARIRVAGFAEFKALGARACLMSYTLELDLGERGALPGWSDPMFEGHAASASMSDFRDFVLRAL